jgi:MFS family permease
MLLVCRIIASLGIGGEWAAGAAMVAEVVPEKKRVAAGALLYTSAPAGLFLATYVTYFIQGVAFPGSPESSWRLVFLFGLIPAFVAFGLRFLIKEPETFTKNHNPSVLSLFSKPLRHATFSGLGMALVANALDFSRAWWTTSFVVHVVYTYPFAFLVMLAIFNRFDRTVEEAAWSLGVSPIRTFRKITFPLIFPGVLSAMLFAFTLSYDEFSRTLFTAGGDLTLPLTIYGTFSVEIHPNLFAFGVLTTAESFTMLAVYGLLMAMSVRRAKHIAMQEEVK